MLELIGDSYKARKDVDHRLDGMRKAGLPES
jgi:hypothetical protein